jgi:hypothetical protein
VVVGVVEKVSNQEAAEEVVLVVTELPQELQVVVHQRKPH